MAGSWGTRSSSPGTPSWTCAVCTGTRQCGSSSRRTRSVSIGWRSRRRCPLTWTHQKTTSWPSPTGGAVPEVRGVSAILLAAGSGSRFGGGKLLAPYRGRPLIEAALANLADAPVDEKVVVVGDDAGRLRPVCEPYGVHVVENPEWQSGQSTSVRAGLLALGPEVRAAGAVEHLVAAFEAGPMVAVATYGGRRRNPVLFYWVVWRLLESELSGDA